MDTALEDSCRGHSGSPSPYPAISHDPSPHQRSRETYGVFYCEFDFDSHEWSCSHTRKQRTRVKELGNMASIARSTGGQKVLSTGSRTLSQWKRTRAQAHIQAHTHTGWHTGAHTGTYTQAYTQVETQAHTLTHTHTHMETHRLTHGHTQKLTHRHIHTRSPLNRTCVCRGTSNPVACWVRSQSAHAVRRWRTASCSGVAPQRSVTLAEAPSSRMKNLRSSR